MQYHYNSRFTTTKHSHETETETSNSMWRSKEKIPYSRTAEKLSKKDQINQAIQAQAQLHHYPRPEEDLVSLSRNIYR